MLPLVHSPWCGKTKTGGWWWIAWCYDFLIGFRGKLDSFVRNMIILIGQSTTPKFEISKFGFIFRPKSHVEVNSECRYDNNSRFHGMLLGTSHSIQVSWCSQPLRWGVSLWHQRTFAGRRGVAHEEVRRNPGFLGRKWGQDGYLVAMSRNRHKTGEVDWHFHEIRCRKATASIFWAAKYWCFVSLPAISDSKFMGSSPRGLQLLVWPRFRPFFSTEISTHWHSWNV